ncbi:MAG: UDP-glucose--hexose-1-phosphate uridylyltransferase [Chloroflexi bacterium]|nr:UDP-glucose--hexose-1-phosphate uridylyltransferase [Chloroflexota bacterium]
MEFFSHPHRRYNPFTGEWVLVSPHRTNRPWQGQVETVARQPSVPYDPGCYLCPGNTRAKGGRNPRYEGVFVFDNDFAALNPETPLVEFDERGLLRASTERGICRVMCFSPRHDLTLPELSVSDIHQVVDVWAQQTAALGSLDFVSHVQIFENKGALMGASSPHPHCQVWGSKTVPTEAAKELRALSAHLEERGVCLVCDYVALELAASQRIVLQNEHFVIVVPFWAVWPFETLVLPRRHLGGLPELSAMERLALAEALKRLIVCYDNLFETAFPYSMGFHQAPTDGAHHPEMHLHAHYYPPLLHSATVRKFMVGYEMLGNPQRDLTPEAAAARLRQVAEDRA